MKQSITLLAVLVITGCAAPDRSAEQPAGAQSASSTIAIDESQQAPFRDGPYSRTFSDPFVHPTYQLAVEHCYFYPESVLASQLRVPNDRERIAREYSAGSQEGAYRDAAYVGCMEGLTSPGAGEQTSLGAQVLQIHSPIGDHRWYPDHS